MQQENKIIPGCEETEHNDKCVKYNTIEVYEEVNKSSLDEVHDLVQKYFGRTTPWVYAVLDFTVGFGIYKDSSFFIYMGGQKEYVPLEWEYLKELRVFDVNGELRLVPLKGGWAGRFRGCIPEYNNSNVNPEEYIIDEQQKLWGKAQISEKINSKQWSLLTSDRGTKIWVPINLGVQQEAALLVRKFMRIPTWNHQELVYQVDMRMVGFDYWKEEAREGGQ